MTIKDLIAFFETIAPRTYQESYDNSGLITGNAATEINGVLVSLDCTEAVVEEAIALKCNVVVAHHPIVFSGLKTITGKTYVERTIIKSIKNDIAIYAIHTNLDNVFEGVNKAICDKLGLLNCKILSPKMNALKKLVTFVPDSSAESLRQALFGAGAGNIGNYDSCSYNTIGYGTFKANENANPFVGKKNELHTEPETRIEVIFESVKQIGIINALRTNHPYEEPAFDIYTLDNYLQTIGAGMCGYLAEPLDEKDFLELVKTKFNLQCIRHTQMLGQKITKVAVCGGAGSFLLGDAMAAGAQIFITSDFKYHQFFDADGRIVIADIGHFESEQFTINLIYDLLNQNFNTFALHFTKSVTNPVKYFI
nr:Nif3-like dinuclear metal center hexameric protein [Bacteroidota bacterium]